MPPPTIEQALGIAEAFRNGLLGRANAALDDKRSCYELANQVHSLDSRTDRHRTLQQACQVIDDLVLALKAEKSV